MKQINKITYHEIPQLSRTIQNLKSYTDKRPFLSQFMDSTLLEEIDHETVEVLYSKTIPLIETKIESLIKERTGQTKIPVGTKIMMRFDFNENLRTGDEAKIEKVERFEEDIFGYGWYYYTIKGCRVYRDEFEILNEKEK